MQHSHDQPRSALRSLRRLALFALAAGLTLFCSCTGMYFRKAEGPPSPQQPVLEWPVREYWTGIVFNGTRIGFTHFNMSPAPVADRLYDIRSEAYIHTRYLWMDKTIHLESFDRVGADLTLKRFHYAYNLDDNRMTVEGSVKDELLVYTLQTRGQTTHRTVVLQRPVFPAGATGLYPLLQGLALGNHHRYDVFDGQTQRIEPFEQQVVAYEESELYSGPAFKVIGRFLGQKVTTWMDADGNPLLEMSLGGILIAALEDETIARRALTRAALNKEENLIEFSRIKIDRTIIDPQQTVTMRVLISGVPDSVPLPSDFRQRCRRAGDQHDCSIDVRSESTEPQAHRQTQAELAPYLQPTHAIAARHPDIEQLVAKIVPASADQQRKVRSIVEWQQAHIRREPVDVFTALDVLETRKAECQGQALLFAALARSAGIPTRVVNGIVYLSEWEGFLYHSWNESHVDGHWMTVDPTFGQFPADATHIKLVEGHSLADLLPLLDLIGRIQLQVIAVQ